MQTSAISYRVADFLKQYPPWQYMDQADLLDLAARGRVKFHEVGEFILWQDAPLNPNTFVIEHGSVALWQDSGEGEQLADMRGAGDVVGIDRYHGATKNVHSVKSASDAVLYAFPADLVEKLLAKYPQAQRFIQAHNTVTSTYSPVDQRKGPHETLLYEAVRPAEPVVRPGSTTLQQAAEFMQSGAVAAIAIAADDGRIAGVITVSDLLRAMAGGAEGKRPIKDYMDAAPVIVAPTITVSQAALALGKSGVIAVTQGAEDTGRLHGLITTADLGPAFGDHPTEILLEIPRAVQYEGLRRLNQRARTFALEHLTSPAAVDWIADFLHRVDVAILERLAVLLPPPAGQYCWCVFGSAGRAEAMTPVIHRAVILLGEGASHPAFTQWYERIQAALSECGYLARSEHFEASYSCATFETWQNRYVGWIRDPLTNSIYAGRHLFDLRAVMGDFSLWRRLEESLEKEARNQKMFVRLLANDCLSALPPLTFFQDVVIDESGVESEIFNIERSALRPLVDVGRVFGIAAGRILGASTLERFRLARTLLPEQESIFREASESLRVVLHQQARTGIRQQNKGAELSPAMLSQYDRQVLKSAFRHIHRLLEFTADGEWMEKS